MNYALIRNRDIANGEGVRTSLFVSGCSFHCPGCFNKEAQDFSYGQPYTDETGHLIIDEISKPYVAGLSILGGDPLCQDYVGIHDLIQLCQRVHALGKTVWLWTGFLWEDICDFSFPDDDMDDYKSAQMRLLTSCDVVVDGRFKAELADRKLVWRGSANQRVIDVKKTIKSGHVELYAPKRI